MSASKYRKLVRNFPENGPKWLCENPANVRDLLSILREPAVDAIDFAAMTVERTHFVKPDYAHLATDMLLKAPFHSANDVAADSIFIYVLIEHQSKPQRFIQLRLAEYVLEAYKMQKRAWDDQHDSDAGLMLHPVLPVVLYTGDRSWAQLESLADLVHEGKRFHEVIPSFKPHFLNLRDTPSTTLAERGGFFGQVLRLIQQRDTDRDAFRQLLEEVVKKLESMTETERTRWLEFLAYAQAMVYHYRSGEEQREMADLVDRSIQNKQHREEYEKMGRTIAEMYIEQGIEKGIEKGELNKGRAILVRMLRKRFKRVPRAIETRIAATTDLKVLDTWLDKVIDAPALADVGIE